VRPAPLTRPRALTFHRWDEWVPAARLLKDNEENRALQKSLQKNAPSTASAARAHPKASTSGANKDSGAGTSASATTRSGTRKETGTRGTKRGRDDVRYRCIFHAIASCLLCDMQADGNRRPEMRLNIPEQIKRKLVDDWETVTKNQKVGRIRCLASRVYLSDLLVGVASEVSHGRGATERV
jgi:mortality factor 4-like protein 1